MTVTLTKRMKAWIETGCHLNVASSSGSPFVTLARFAKVTADDEIAFVLSKDEYGVIGPALTENPWVAIGISGVGGIRAAYQFKGIGTIAKEGPILADAKAAGIEPHVALYVKLSEVYCTKPGAEAGARLDIKGAEELAAWDESRWKDMPPKG